MTIPELKLYSDVHRRIILAVISYKCALWIKCQTTLALLVWAPAALYTSSSADWQPMSGGIDVMTI